MLNITPTDSQTRFVAPIPGVPDSQARALDRRRRLNQQLQSFLATERVLPVIVTPSLDEPAERVPA
jgi:hypothetical protein